MWSSIEQVMKPETFNEVLVLRQEAGSALFTGGSYLVAQKDQQIKTLVDINHLLLDTVNSQRDGLHLGAGCTLQSILSSSTDTLSEAIIASCPSKNIRNQRTLGGEIAQGRADSELLVYLHAAEAKLQINDSGAFIHIADWDKMGVITEILIPQNKTKLERVTVLDSAPAFVIVAQHQTAEYITRAIGGKATKILYCKTPVIPDEEQNQKFMDEVEALFPNDHFGSPTYKRQLVSNLLTEMMVAI